MDGKAYYAKDANGLVRLRGELQLVARYTAICYDLEGLRESPCITNDIRHGEVACPPACRLIFLLPKGYRPATEVKSCATVLKNGEKACITIGKDGFARRSNSPGDFALGEREKFDDIEFAAAGSTTSLYLYEKDTGQAYDLVANEDRLQGGLSGLKGVGFASDGTVIGYNADGIYDLSPKSKKLAVTALDPLDPLTIYSADTVTVAAVAAADLPANSEVVLKGNRVELPGGFKWPLGRTLHVQSVKAN